MKKTVKRRGKPIHPSIIYTESDYNSNDGMLTSVWGPGMWHYLHTMSFNYPINPTNSAKTHYRDFILNLKFTLPCGKCRINLCNNLKKLPIRVKDMKNRETFSKYIYDLHELINEMLNKKSGLTYEQVRERYEHFRSRCSISKNKTAKRVKSSKKPIHEDGCTEPLYGEKSKCILKIVPINHKCKSLEIDEKCIKSRNASK